MLSARGWLRAGARFTRGEPCASVPLCGTRGWRPGAMREEGEFASPRAARLERHGTAKRDRGYDDPRSGSKPSRAAGLRRSGTRSVYELQRCTTDTHSSDHEYPSRFSRRPFPGVRVLRTGAGGTASADSCCESDAALSIGPGARSGWQPCRLHRAPCRHVKQPLDDACVRHRSRDGRNAADHAGGTQLPLAPLVARRTLAELPLLPSRHRR